MPALNCGSSPPQAAWSDPPFFPRTLAARTQAYSRIATLHRGVVTIPAVPGWKKPGECPFRVALLGLFHGEATADTLGAGRSFPPVEPTGVGGGVTLGDAMLLLSNLGCTLRTG